MRLFALVLALCACDAPDAEPVARRAVEAAAPPPVLTAGRMYQTAQGTVRVDGATPGATVRFWVSVTGTGSGPCVAGVCLGIRQAAELGDAVAGPDGRATVSWPVPGTASATAWFQAVDLSAATATNVAQARVYAADHDSDREGLADLEELALGTDPFKRDTDSDNANDLEEVTTLGTDPLDPDVDDDGVRDGREDVYNLDPFDPDVDGDGLLDGDDMYPTTWQAPDPFVVDDAYAADPTRTLPDPEFDEQLGRAAWQDSAGDELWVVDVDPATGLFSPFSGRGVLLDTGIAPMRYGKNGPEWAYGDGYSTVLYTRRDADINTLWRGDFVGGAWQISMFPASEGQASPIGSLDWDDPTPRLRWIARPGGVQVMGWRELDDPSTDTTAPLALKFSRNVPGSHLIVGTAEVAGVQQVHTWDPRTDVYEQLTTTPSDKGSVFFFNAPELGGERLFFATVADTGGDPVQMAVFRETPGGWQRIKLLTSPPGYPYVVSPEPLITPTGSYVSFLASKEPENVDNGVGTVWIASLAPGSLFARRVSDVVDMRRKDPEPYQGADRPMVFYTEIHSSNRRLIRRCETGL